MFTGIRDFLRISSTSRDPQPVQSQVQQKQEKEGGRREQDAPREDDTLFSISAIRALLTADPLPADLAAVLTREQRDDILAGLTALEAQGIHNIPLRLGQSLLEAVRAALPPR